MEAQTENKRSIEPADFSPEIITSERIEEITKALVKAQATMGTAKKNKENLFLKTKYADMASVWDAIRKPLTDNGISVVQVPTLNAANQSILVTMLLHVSGQWIKGTFLLRGNADMQKVGSELAYVSRYCLRAMAGVPQDDDDGNTASGTKGRPSDEEEPAGDESQEEEGEPQRKSAGKKEKASKVEVKEQDVEFVPGSVKEESGTDADGPWQSWLILGKNGSACFTQDPKAAEIAKEAATLGNKIKAKLVKTASGWKAESIKAVK